MSNSPLKDSGAIGDNVMGARPMARRTLLKAAAALGAAGAVGVSGVRGQAKSNETAEAAKLELAKGAVILFQGDSITDAGRKKEETKANNNKALGRGYPALAAGELLGDYPTLGLQVYNRGVSGNKVPDLAARWADDTIKLKPSILSILVGINDLWHTVAFGSKYKGTIKDYEAGYRDLLLRTQKEVRGVQLVICEPFTLRDWPAFDPYRAVAKKLADEMKLTFVPLQKTFTEAAKAAPPQFWLWDGIHPTPSGHALLLQAWRRVVGI